ncbi:hypothetical protein MUK42_07344 [Musa troglodytarum]|uniref:Uncharacterized protein n=1 Tax=Musa troglodytarum TaxID=320322 RepID=A0A9E7KT76_9LILI|nr:hypothetical protein MUK42_07344 [Musa troglodytarum]
MRSLRSHTWLTRETGPTANLQSTRSHAAAESDELTPPTKQPISPSLEIPNPEGRVGSPRSLLFLLRPLRPFESLDNLTDVLSYEVSRAQHQLIKNIKHSADGIQPKLLGRDDKIESSEGSPEEPTYDRYHRNQHAQDINDKNYGESKDNSIDDHQLELIPPLNSHKEPSLIVHNQEETLQQDDDFSPLSHSVEKQNPKNMWQTAGVSDSYYHSSENHGYTSASELSLRQPQLTMEHPTNMIDLERDIIESEGAEPIPSAFDVDGRASLFCSFGRNEMLPTFPKEPRVMSSYPEHINGMKQAGLQFLMANDDLQESSLVSNQLQEQQQLIEQRDAREKEVYMQQIIPKKVYSTARYPNQGFPSVDRQNLAAVQSSMNSGTRGYNWFPGDDQSYGSWSAVESSRGGGQCLDDGGSADGSLYSVLSNKLSTCSPYDSNSSEQYLQPRSFVGTAIPSAHNIYGYGQHQPDNPSSHQIGVTPSMNNGSWMNFPPQNSELHDPLGRPFQRPWDHQ